MQEQIESWIGVVRPWVEQEYGPLPEFGYEQATLKEIGVPYGIKADFKRNLKTFIYDPKWDGYKPVLNKPITDYSIQPIGIVATGLVHELVHLYQFDPLRKSIGYLRYLPNIIGDPWLKNHYNEWIEGLAELIAMKINFAHMDNKLPPVLETDSFFAMLQTDMFQHASYHNYRRNLVDTVFNLSRAKLITNKSLNALELPFSIPECIKDSVQENLPNYYTYLEETPYYQRGFLRCARVITRTGISMNELLATPLTNKELKKQAGI